MSQAPTFIDTPIEKALTYLKDYVNTYDMQHGYQSFSEETWINDILYGLGLSLSDEYKFSEGFEKFKERLLKELTC